MVKTVLPLLVAVAVALGAGAGSVWMMIEEAPAIDALRVGPWTAFPNAGTPQADPYSRARFVREGGIPLGKAEGIAFTATHDTDGRALRRECAYRLSGELPVSRFWTLYAADPTGVPLPPTGRRAPALHSQRILQAPEGIEITASPYPAPGNWLALSGEGSMQLVLTLFDTPVSTSAGIEQISMPGILRTGCGA
ncbi:DUF1214 domain-containing protein [Nitratireductor thuwali]|uniref:DUF1214 domain-containing protein n=1 Tax=Nitratireductor thuwali TaxID=2267699 RepID=A0ABY5MNE8_9HYPH|nr:hypothetical protein NTH_03389 [Nitratireductor thuwali]